MQNFPLNKAQAGNSRNLTRWLLTATLLVAGFSYAQATQAAAPTWDISGAWALDFTLDSDGSHRFHTMNVTAFNSLTGAFSGTGDTTGTLLPPAPVLYTWTMAGTESAHTLAFTLAYNEIPGYTVDLTGTVTGPTAIGGAWTDNAGNSGTWMGAGIASQLPLYVDDNLGECPDAQFSNIQDALDAAVTGGKVIVCDGTYTTGATVNKSVTIAAGSSPVIDCGGVGNGFTIVVNNVTIDGFEIKQCLNGISGETSGSIFQNNTIHHSYNNPPGSAGVGILLWGDNDNNQILNNTIHSNDRQGIFIGHDTLISTGNTVSGNTLYSNGLYTYANGPDASAYGVQLWNGDHNVISNNEIYGHDDWFAFPGFDFAQGIYLFDSNDNDVTGNNLHDNNYGVGVWGPSRGIGDNRINNNSIVNNTGYGVRTFDAFALNAENNWWGACDGPSGVGPGSGDAVSANVDFDPWTGCHVNITGMKFHDLNGDGVNDLGEPGLENWRIIAGEEVETLPVDSSNSAGATSSLLDAGQDYLVRVSGTYTAGDSITADAKYSVRPPNTLWTDSVQTYEAFGPTLLDLQIDGASPDWGAFNDNHVYWYPVTGTGAGLTFTVNDLFYPNNAGILTVKIYKAFADDLTDSNGDYEIDFTAFVNTLIIAEVTQPGWVNSAPAPDGFSTISALTETHPGLDFGNFKLGRIFGVKYEDLDNNGARDPGEPGLAGWSITLTPTNPSGPSTTVLTDPDGFYEFTDLVSGDYTLAETLQPTWFQSEPVSGSYAVTIGPNADLELNFGNYRLGSLSGMKFKDLNGNGVKDPGDLGLGGWTITLNPGSLTTVTAGDGTYSFPNLIPGLYEVSETIQPGWMQTLPGGTGVQEVFVNSGEDVTDVDFGNFKLGIIKGFKYNVSNGQKLPGWKIILVNLRTGQQQSILTGTGGAYQFNDLPLGRYLLREQLKPRWIPVSPRTGLYNPVIINASGQELTKNFGNFKIP